MKLLFLLIITLSLLFSCNNEKSKDNFVYILSRNSQTKEGDLVLKYNSYNSNISHIGIALEYKNNNSYVYHINYGKMNENESSLFKETFSSFWNSKNEKDNKIWKIRVSQNEHKKIRNYLDSLEKLKIYYDLDSTSSKGLYCLEFVYNALNPTWQK